MSPYRTSEPPPAHSAPEVLRKRFGCYFGRHKTDSFTIENNPTKFICRGMTIRFFCSCGKQLGHLDAPTKRAFTITVPSDWDGMGGGGAVAEA